ncbi:MAG TPA: hypothetical protein PKL77_10040 [Candidatus Omnitrophota bacterium]|nr:hypothetical protein [Candidatus Omnitrophota bacterium]HNX82470.1 hypothetical protein [Candidatus Omnitrophota bacterium]HPT06971.1 hypothetical protein [Candidatus Omnitrophota bacterium]
MDKGNLLKKLAGLGFPLLEADKEGEANATLAELVESRDYRLWEGFPVVLANAAEKGLFDYDKVEACLKSHHDKNDLALLVMFSLALYKTLGLAFSWRDKLYNLFGNEDVQKKYEEYVVALKNNQDLALLDGVMSSQRVKSTFNNYFRQVQVNLDDLLSAKEAMAVEYSLAQVFSPKQKELFLKKLRNEKLTKTEKEYFSRVVKRKVLALANPELHRLAQGVLQ